MKTESAAQRLLTWMRSAGTIYTTTERERYLLAAEAELAGERVLVVSPHSLGACHWENEPTKEVGIVEPDGGYLTQFRPGRYAIRPITGPKPEPDRTAERLVWPAGRRHMLNPQVNCSWCGTATRLEAQVCLGCRAVFTGDRQMGEAPKPATVDASSGRPTPREADRIDPADRHGGDTALCLLGMTRRADALAAELAEVRERLRLAEEDAVGLDHAVVSVLRGRAGSYTMLSVAHAAHEERLHPAAEPKEATP